MRRAWRRGGAHDDRASAPVTAAPACRPAPARYRVVPRELVISPEDLLSGHQPRHVGVNDRPGAHAGTAGGGRPARACRGWSRVAGCLPCHRMIDWPSTRAPRVLAALLRIGWPVLTALEGGVASRRISHGAGIVVGSASGDAGGAGDDRSIGQLRVGSGRSRTILGDRRRREDDLEVSASHGLHPDVTVRAP